MFTRVLLAPGRPCSSSAPLTLCLFYSQCLFIIIIMDTTIFTFELVMYSRGSGFKN